MVGLQPEFCGARVILRIMVLKALLPKTILALMPALMINGCANGPEPVRARPQPLAQAAPQALPQAQAPVHAPPLYPLPPPRTQPAPVVAPAASTHTQPMAAPRGGYSIALLLPLSGSYASSAEAVRDGFLSAYFADAAHPRLRVYDIGATPDSLRLAYQRALGDGATMLVGPLTKEGVAALSAYAPPVPVLGLNYLDAGTPTPFNFFQFGLAPEDEARAAAQQALAQNRRRAVALVPSSEWGQRVLAAFEQTLRAGGGAVVRAERYTQGVSDQSKLIAGLMGMTASEERHNALTAVLGQKSEFEAQRRSDIDLVFVGARSQDARLLIPQLRFNRVGDLPIYATSLVYDGKPTGDLNGLRFCDAPWLIDGAGPVAAQRNAVASLGSASASPRLFAMGRDAYTLAGGLLRGSLRVGDGVDGVTGRLQWSGSSVIGRQLGCAQIAGTTLQILSP